jgi:hypothetical protein
MMADPRCQADPLPCATAQLGKLNGRPAYRLILPVPVSVGGKARIAGGGYGVQYLVSVAGYSEAMSDGGQGAGGDVQVYPFNTSNNQRWNIWWGGTAWMLTNIGNGLCANDQYGSAANGTPGQHVVVQHRRHSAMVVPPTDRYLQPDIRHMRRLHDHAEFEQVRLFDPVAWGHEFGRECFDPHAKRRQLQPAVGQ